MTTKEKSRPGTTPAGQKLDRLIFRGELIDVVGVSYVTVWSWMRAGTFPRGRDIGGRTAWIESEVAAWIASRPIRRLSSPLTKSGSADSLRLWRFGRVIGDGNGAVGGGSGRPDGDVGGDAALAGTRVLRPVAGAASEGGV